MTFQAFVSDYLLFLVAQIFLIVSLAVLFPLFISRVVKYVRSLIHKSVFGDVDSIDDISYTKI